MDLEPGESKIMEVNFPREGIQAIEFYVEWYCPNCLHLHEKTIIQKPKEQGQLSISCPCCTPWYLKLKNLFLQWCGQ